VALVAPTNLHTTSVGSTTLGLAWNAVAGAAGYELVVALATVPGVPTGVTATAGNTQATVSWLAPGNNGGSAIIDYTVTSSPGGFTATTSGLSTTVTGLTNGTAYTFTVKARNSVGLSAASAASAAVTPSAPTGTLYFDGNFSSGNFNAYSGGNIVSPADIVIINDPILGAGRKVVRISVNDGDTGGVTTDNRAQLETPQQWFEGADIYIGCGFMLDASFPDLGSSMWATFAQVFGPPYGGSAPYSVDFNNGTVIEFDGYTDSTNMRRGVWYDFVVHEKLSTSTGNSLAEMWVNQGSGYVYINSNLGHGATLLAGINDGGNNYHKIANYTGASQWTSGQYPITVYFSCHKVGSTFAIVDPHSYG
jgi:hypothetical protein